MKTKRHFFLFGLMLLALLALNGCTPKPSQVKPLDEAPPIYPAYHDITIPYNIAPLNFLFRDEGVEALQLVIADEEQTPLMQLNSRGRKVRFNQKEWRTMLANQRGRRLTATLTAKRSEGWVNYRPMTWLVASEPVDGYVSYRLIEPGYEVWNELQLCERHLESFDERVIADNSRLGGRCMNCHIHGSQRGDLTMFHLRGAGGGTLVNRQGQLRKLALKAGPMNSGAVYGDFHPSGRYGVFSTNIIIPAFHAQGNRRLEVYDTTSDLVMADFDANRLYTSPLVSDTTRLETFPTFSADGAWVYFCSAPLVKPLPQEVKRLRYSLCRITFDAATGRWGERVDTLWNARTQGGSVCHPKASPDGRYLLYTLADYGTFPIWHRETQLQLMDLQTGEVNPLTEVNSDRSETYHSWSSNSRWFAFASKRGDGQYGRIYLAYVDAEGRVHRPFVLPQKDPEHDDLNLKSYNLPDLSQTPVTISSSQVEEMLTEPAEAMRWEE